MKAYSEATVAGSGVADAIVIVGSGLAGYTLARAIRKRDQGVPITLITRDHGGYYSKPMLSNALSKNRAASTLVIKSAGDMAKELNVTILTRTALSHIEPARRLLRLCVGTAGETTELPYRALVLALGAEPVELRLEGSGAADLLHVNDLDDYARFTSRLAAGAFRVAILGAGLIGCEFANDLLSRGIQSTLLDPASHPLAALLPAQAAHLFRERMEAAGISFRLEETARRVDWNGTRYEVTTSANHTLYADLVLSAVGLRPRLGAAREAGVRTNRGIQTNAFLETSEAGIYATGDCAEVGGLVLPYVAPIMHQAAALAATLTGTRSAVSYPPMPVIVKTPACPTSVCLPPGASLAEAAWTIEPTDDGLQALFGSAESPSATSGFALVGASASARRHALLTSLAM